MCQVGIQVQRGASGIADGQLWQGYRAGNGDLDCTLFSQSLYWPWRRRFISVIGLPQWSILPDQTPMPIRNPTAFARLDAHGHAVTRVPRQQTPWKTPLEDHGVTNAHLQWQYIISVFVIPAVRGLSHHFILNFNPLDSRTHKSIHHQWTAAILCDRRKAVFLPLSFGITQQCRAWNICRVFPKPTCNPDLLQFSTPHLPEVLTVSRNIWLCKEK